MPSKMFYSTISPEIARICSVTSFNNYFLSSVLRFIIHIKKQAEINNIIKALTSLSNSKLSAFSKNCPLNKK